MPLRRLTASMAGDVMKASSARAASGRGHVTDTAAEKVVSFGGYLLNLATRELSRDGEPVSLTSGEFAVLKVLVSHPREPLSRDKLMNLARGREYTATERSIDVQVSRLRRLLEQDPAQPRYLQTVWGLGYVFVPDGEND